MSQTQNIEQQITLLSNLQLGFGIAALILLALAVFLFFYLHIPQVFNEYHGKSAQREMEAMAADGSESGRITSAKKSRKKKGSGDNVQRRHYTDNLTDDISKNPEKPIGKTEQMESQLEFGNVQESMDQNGMEATDVLNESMTNGAEATDVLQEPVMDGSVATDVLNSNGAYETETLEHEWTELLEENSTEPLSSEDPGATDILTEKMLQEEGMAATDVLNSSQRVEIETGMEHDGTMVLAPEMLRKSQSIFEVERSIILIHTEKVI